MITSRWKKAFNDLFLYKGRSLLVILAITIGMWGIGSVVSSYVILLNDIEENFIGTDPASVTFWTKESIPDDIVEALKDHPEVAEAELRQKVNGRVLVGEQEWDGLNLFVVRDFSDLRVATFTLQEGEIPQGDNQVLVERDGWTMIDTPLGGDLVIRLPGSKREALKIVGRTHDPGQAPSHMDHIIYGYINLATYNRLVPGGKFNELKILTVKDRFDRAYNRRVKDDVKAWLEDRGFTVYRTEVPIPGRHPHQGQLSSLLFLQMSIGLIALFLSSILVSNIINFLLAKQIRQIGIMKAIGARPMQVMQLYYFVIFCLSVVAVVLGITLGVKSGFAYADFVGIEINFNILTTSLPLWTYALLTFLGIAIPMAVAAGPIYRGTRITVREALNDYGLSTKQGKSDESADTSNSLAFLSRPVVLAVRNTFRQKSRTFLTIGTLVFGLVIFISAFNIRSTLTKTLQMSAEGQRYDLSVYFLQPHSIDSLKPVIESIEGVKKVDYWNGDKVSIVYEDQTLGSLYPLIAPPIPTDIFDARMAEGRWFEATDENVVIFNQASREFEPHLKLGNTVNLNIRGVQVPFKLIGFIKQIGSVPLVYIPNQTLVSLTQRQGAANNLRIAATDPSQAAVVQLGQKVEETFEKTDMDVVFTLRKLEELQIIEDHLSIITIFLLGASFLALVVAGLGLVSTMNINILERTREIGVMRAVGASTRTIRKMITVEGVIIGVVSWCIAYIISIPASYQIGGFFGRLILEMDLDFAISGLGFIASLITMLVFIVIASVTPMWNISRLSVRNALAYE